MAAWKKTAAVMAVLAMSMCGEMTAETEFIPDPVCQVYNGMESEAFGIGRASAEVKRSKIRPGCIVARFADHTGCTEVDSDALMEDFITEELMAEDLFSLRSISGDISYPEEWAFWLNRDFVVKTGLQENAKYMLAGTILDVRSGKEEDFCGSLIGNIAGLSNPRVLSDYVEVKAEIWLVNTRSGRVVWHSVKTGRESDSYVNSKEIKLGDLSVDEEQYYKAVEKCSRELVKALKKEVDKGKLYL